MHWDLSYLRAFLLGVAALFAVSGSTAEATDAESAIRPTNLTVDYQANRVGVDSATPIFGWELAGGKRLDVEQVSYRIRVASAASLLETPDALLWDGDRVASDQTQGIVYQGKPLESSSQYFWSVEVETKSRAATDETNSPETTERSIATGNFVTGVLRPEDWKAKWITMNRTDADPLPVFQKEFDLDQPKENVETAIIHICGLGQYALSLNKRPVEPNRRIDPGWTNYRKTCLYSTYQFSTKSNVLQDSGNQIWVSLGNGMFNVPGGRYVKYTGSFGKPKLICQMVVRYKDGSTQTVVSDETWKAAFGPIDFSCVYGGEDWNFDRFEKANVSQKTEESSAETAVSEEIDLSQEISANDEEALREKREELIKIRSWQDAILTESPGGVLRAQEQPPIKVVEPMIPEAVSVLPDGRIEANFGFNFSGQPLVYCAVPKGRTIKITLAEMKEKPWGGHSYSLTGSESSEKAVVPFSPLFSYWGFQYLYIEGAKWIGDPDVQKILKEKNVKAIPAAAEVLDSPLIFQIRADYISSSANDVGSFDSDGPWLDEINQMVDRSVRSNLQSCITDCPHREKLGWLEVAHLMGPSIMYNYDIHTLYRKICRDMTEAQLDDGMIPDIAPEYTRFVHGFFWSAEWSSSAVQVPWLLYRWYGDAEIFERQYETMDRYVRYMAGTRNDRGLVRAGLGDWYDWSPEKSHAGYSQHTPGELTATAFLIGNAQIMTDVAKMLNKTDDVSYYSALTEEAKTDFQKAYYHPETKVVATGSQASYAFALYFRLVPEEDRDAVLANLIADIEKWEYRPTTGEVAFRYLIRSLADAGRSDVLWKMIQRDSAPGYVHMLKHWGMKTLSETWDGPGSSMNHCMFGHIQEWFVANILGIGQTERSIGYSEILLRPEPMKNEIKRAKGSYRSVRGEIFSDWNVFETKFNWRFSIPENATAIVQIPVVDENSDYSIRSEDSKVAAEQVGFEPSSNGNPARVSVKLGSGEYRIESTIYAAE